MPQKELGKTQAQVEYVADQLSECISGNFDFSVRIEDAGYSVQKLSIMINFLLQRIRDHSSAIESSCQYVQTIIQSMQDMVLVVDSSKKIKIANRAALIALSHQETDLIGQPIGKIFSSCENIGLGEFQEETFFVSRQGLKIPILLSVSPVRFKSSVDYVFTAKNLTEQKRLEKEILKVGDDVQRRVSHDLHDGLGQYLTGILYMCKGLATKLELQSSEGASELKEIMGLVNTTIAQTKTLSKSLDPFDFENGGLVFALRELAEQMGNRFSVRCIFRSMTAPSDFRDSVYCKHLYYIVQEAIANAVKHGKSKNILVELEGNHERFSLIIADDGIGMNSGDLTTGFGLKIMSYRAESIGCKIEIQTKDNHGTIIICSN